MNYFAHGRNHSADPYFLAGTAVPDWLSVVNRRVRVRPKHIEPYTNDADPVLAALARGIARHHEDDAWFHQTRAFAELSLRFTREIRDLNPGDDGLRPFFLGHIAVELLLDAALIAAEPDRLHTYYAVVERVDPAAIEAAVTLLSGRDAAGLARFISLFQSERFLWDYADDGKLMFRLDQVLRRVRLPPLPQAFAEWLPGARAVVAARADELLNPPNNFSDSNKDKL